MDENNESFDGSLRAFLVSPNGKMDFFFQTQFLFRHIS